MSDYVRAAADDQERSYSDTFRQGLVALSDMLDSLSPHRAAEGETWRPDPAKGMSAAVLQITYMLAVDLGLQLEMPGNEWAEVSLSESAAIEDLELELPRQRQA
ncbi:hypothetical protein [Falsiroseomonas oryzae]|uniref:hypothetical protein n=1 Tax=Falsiroseomonas oryzae TaxID=2766473 RepID=UPI0022EA8F80|nr:hypothetical protein [Roseomonas sp. MO-31]